MTGIGVTDSSPQVDSFSSGVSVTVSSNQTIENGQTVTTNYTITNGYNAMSAGPVTINNGVAVTIGTGENWTIV